MELGLPPAPSPSGAQTRPSAPRLHTCVCTPLRSVIVFARYQKTSERKESDEWRGTGSYARPAAPGNAPQRQLLSGSPLPGAHETPPSIGSPGRPPAGPSSGRCSPQVRGQLRGCPSPCPRRPSLGVRGGSPDAPCTEAADCRPLVTPSWVQEVEETLAASAPPQGPRWGAAGSPAACRCPAECRVTALSAQQLPRPGGRQLPSLLLNTIIGNTHSCLHKSHTHHVRGPLDESRNLRPPSSTPGEGRSLTATPNPGLVRGAGTGQTWAFSPAGHCGRGQGCCSPGPASRASVCAGGRWGGRAPLRKPR